MASLYNKVISVLHRIPPLLLLLPPLRRPEAAPPHVELSPLLDCFLRAPPPRAGHVHDRHVQVSGTLSREMVEVRRKQAPGGGEGERRVRGGPARRNEVGGRVDLDQRGK